MTISAYADVLVYSSQGQVTTKRQGTEEWTAAPKGTDLKFGDEIRTGEKLSCWT